MMSVCKNENEEEEVALLPIPSTSERARLLSPFGRSPCEVSYKKLYAMGIAVLCGFSLGYIWGSFLQQEMGPSSSIRADTPLSLATLQVDELPQHAGEFQQYLNQVPWDDWEAAVREGDRAAIEAHTFQAISDLGRFAALEPKVPINSSCSQPPPLPKPETIDCSMYPKAFTGVKRSKPAKMAHLVQLGFDTDVLEIHLREIADVVDYFFILEATRAQNKLVRKPLMWEMVRDQERFKPFKEKVIHLVLDDVDGTPDAERGDDIWFLEEIQEDRRWRRFVEWNAKTKYFSEDDVIGFGDSDEIANRKNLHLLKHCQIEGPVDIGIWFPFGLLTQAFQSDWPVPNHPLTLGDPTYWPLWKAMSLQRKSPPSRERGGSRRYLLGGMHMTNHRYLPFLLLKQLTCSECGVRDPQEIRTMADLARAGNLTAMELKLGNKKSGAGFEGRLVKVEDAKDELREIALLPWFYACNRDRYPYWEKRHDTRVE